jgi:hypothetical protein
MLIFAIVWATLVLVSAVVMAVAIRNAPELYEPTTRRLPPAPRAPAVVIEDADTVEYLIDRPAPPGWRRRESASHSRLN